MRWLRVEDWDSPEFRIAGSFPTPADRFRVELDKLFSAFPNVGVAEDHGHVTAVAGSFEPLQGGVVRDFRIDVPADYPRDEPEAHTVGWSCTGPHALSETQMCLWLPNHWSKSLTLAYTVAKTYTWITKHEVFLGDGHWPGTGQDH